MFEWDNIIELFKQNSLLKLKFKFIVNMNYKEKCLFKQKNDIVFVLFLYFELWTISD